MAVMSRPAALGGSGGKTRFTADFDADFDAMLSELAKSKGTTKADIIRRSVASYNFLEQNADEKQGQKVSITDKLDRVLKDVILP